MGKRKGKTKGKKRSNHYDCAPYRQVLKDNFIPKLFHDMVPQIQEWCEEVEGRYPDFALKFKFSYMVSRKAKSKSRLNQDCYTMAFWLKLKQPSPDLMALINEHRETIFEAIPFLTYLDLYRYCEDAYSLPWDHVSCFRDLPVWTPSYKEEGAWYDYVDYPEEENPILRMFEQYPVFNLADALAEFRSSMEAGLIESYSTRIEERTMGKRKKKGRKHDFYLPRTWFFKDNDIPNILLHDMLPKVEQWEAEVNRRYQCDFGVKFRCLVEGKRPFLDNSYDYEMAFWLKLRNPLPPDLMALMDDYCDIIYEEIPFLTYLDIYRYDSYPECLPWKNVRCYGNFPDYEKLIEEEEYYDYVIDEEEPWKNKKPWEDYYSEEDNPILVLFEEYPEFNLADALAEFRSSVEEELIESY